MLATVCCNTCFSLHFICVCRHKGFITVLCDYSSMSVCVSLHIYLLVVVFVLKEGKAVSECSDGVLIALSIVS